MFGAWVKIYASTLLSTSLPQILDMPLAWHVCTCTILIQIESTPWAVVKHSGNINIDLVECHLQLYIMAYCLCIDHRGRDWSIVQWCWCCCYGWRPPHSPQRRAWGTLPWGENSAILPGTSTSSVQHSSIYIVYILHKWATCILSICMRHTCKGVHHPKAWCWYPFRCMYMYNVIAITTFFLRPISNNSTVNTKVQ